MNDLTIAQTTTLPTLIDRASAALVSAKSSAEVLEARDIARVAYDAAKSAGRMAKAKKAHEEVMSAVYRAQADALLIEARAKMRLADEYDAAQARGEVGQSGTRTDLVGDHNEVPATAADIGLRRDEIHEARKLRDAEKADPGKTEAALSAIVERGEEPTKAKLRREVEGQKHEAKQEAAPDPNAKLRAEYRRLTEEAREDEWINMRLDLVDANKRIERQRGEIADLKREVKDLSSQSDIGAKLSARVREVQALKLARDNALTDAKRMEYRMKKAIEERDAALASLRAQEIRL